MSAGALFFLSGVFGKKEIYIQDRNLLHSHPDFGLIEILMIIRFCILPAGLSGAGDCTEMLRTKEHQQKPRSSWWTERSKGGTDAQGFSKIPGRQHPSQNPSSCHFYLLIQYLRDRLILQKKIKIILNKTRVIYFFF